MRFPKVLFVFFFLLNINVFSQSAIGIDITGIGYHPFGNPNHDIYENSISHDGTWVVSPGLIFSYQKYFILTHTSFQFSQGLYSDAVGQFAGSSALYLKRKFFHKSRNAFSLALGGAYLFRDKWSDVNGYVTDYRFTSGRKYEYKWGFTAELKYYYYLSNRFDYSMGFVYGHECETFTMSFGIKYWVSPFVKIKANSDGPRYNEANFHRRPIRTWIKRHIKI